MLLRKQPLLQTFTVIERKNIDEIRIYDYALNDSEILGIYNSYTNKPIADFTFSPDNPKNNTIIQFTDQ